MAQARLKLMVPVIQVVIAVGLLTLGSQQVPTVKDDPPFVPRAAKLCYGINAPVALWQVGLAVLLQKTHLKLGHSQRAVSDACLLGGVALLWFLVGLTVELRLRNIVIAARLFVDCTAVILGVALAPFAVAAWKQDEMFLVLGFGTWSAVLVLAWALDLARCVTLTLQHGLLLYYHDYIH